MKTGSFWESSKPHALGASIRPSVDTSNSCAGKDDPQPVLTKLEEDEEYEYQMHRCQSFQIAALKAETEAREARELIRAYGMSSTYNPETDVPKKVQRPFSDSYQDWEEDTESKLIGKLSMTSCGPGRVSRVVVDQQQATFVTVKLLAGGTVQVCEAVAMKWINVIEDYLGEMVIPPTTKVAGKTEGADVNRNRGKKGGFHVFARLPEPDGLVVSDALVRGRQIAFRLVSPLGFSPVVRIVDERDLAQWERGDFKRLYLVDLATTPAGVGHVQVYRHDYRKSRDSYEKGELVIVEGPSIGMHDVGTVRDVLLGERVDEHLKSEVARNAGGGIRRLLWRCSELERAKRLTHAAALEKTVLQILEVRLPTGCQALGVGASLDGAHVRLFVQFPIIAANVENSANGEASNAVQQEVRVTVAALGALLGCETELLACQPAILPENPPAAQDQVAHQSADSRVEGTVEDCPTTQMDPVEDCTDNASAPANGLKRCLEEEEHVEGTTKPEKKTKKSRTKRKKKKKKSKKRTETSSSDSSDGTSSSSAFRHVMAKQQLMNRL